MLRNFIRILPQRSLRLHGIRQMATEAPRLILKDRSRPLRIDRELPNPNEDKVKQRLGFVGFSLAIAAALTLIFNYEKTESPIVSNTLYHLRRSSATRDLLGENIEFDGLIPWVYGELNQVAGKVNIKFYIKGSKNVPGKVKLVAGRDSRLEEFLIHEWSLTVDDKKIDLLSENDVKTL